MLQNANQEFSFPKLSKKIRLQIEIYEQIMTTNETIFKYFLKYINSIIAEKINEFQNLKYNLGTIAK